MQSQIWLQIKNKRLHEAYLHSINKDLLIISSSILLVRLLTIILIVIINFTSDL